MASIVNTPPSGQYYLDAMFSGTQWASNVITYSFPTAVNQYEYTVNGFAQFAAFNPAQQAAVRADLAQIASFTQLQFVEVTGGAGVIRFAEAGLAAGVGGYSFYPSTEAIGGDAFIAPTEADAPVRGAYSWYVIAHELGHALGLKHPSTTTSGDLQPSEGLEKSVMDQRQYPSDDAGQFDMADGNYPTTYMMYDIQALQYMYGANYNTNSGNTVYSWNSKTGQMTINGVAQAAPATPHVFMTIWDGGGVDAYDFSGWGSNSLRIDLRPGGSSGGGLSAPIGGPYPNALHAVINPANGNVAEGIVYNALLYSNDPRSLIENATGAASDDFIDGNQANNVLVGGGGDDVIHGYSGNDTLIGGTGFSGQAALGLLDGGSGNDVLWFYGNTQIVGGDGFDYAVQLSGGSTTRDIGAADIEVFVANTGADSITAANATAYTIIYGGADGDQLVEGSGGGYLFGQDGNDVLIGGAGADTLIGGDGNDSQVGAGGNDVIYIDAADGLNFDGGEGVDYAILESTGGVTLNLSTRNVEVFIGNAGNDFIEAGTTTTPMGLYGFSGNDNIAGGAGASQLFGQDGADILNGGASNDTLLGGDGADQLYGNAGDDLLIGEAGGDLIVGGRGADDLWGGGGDDLFRFNFSDFGAGVVDEIWDFGDVAGNNDQISFVGVTAAQLTTASIANGVQFTAIAQGGGIYTLVVYGISAGAIQDDMLFG